ncbi:TfuA-like protein [Hoeflea sp. TYP-13]|uniref:TfuA-like protein n=1 Tax=Hoeflea sp. TYP-13 TaxID=3230023 RepID=UPI0034C6860F
MMRIVFAGPSLAGENLDVHDGFEFRPPVKQGDLYLAAMDNPTAIGIIDGVFDGVPSVWHKEILWALSLDIPVYGSASMGALRAAELDSFGMVGIGAIYEAYRDGVLEDDDEVALQHGPAEIGYAPLSLPMVNVRATLLEAERAGVLTKDQCKALAAAAKPIFFKQRTWDAVLERQSAVQDQAVLLEWLKRNDVDQKKQDALTLLAHMKDAGIGPSADFDFEHTELWQRGVTEWQSRAPVAETAEDGAYRLVPHERLFRWSGSEE